MVGFLSLKIKDKNCVAGKLNSEYVMNTLRYTRRVFQCVEILLILTIKTK